MTMRCVQDVHTISHGTETTGGFTKTNTLFPLADRQQHVVGNFQIDDHY